MFYYYSALRHARSQEPTSAQTLDWTGLANTEVTTSGGEFGNHSWSGLADTDVTTSGGNFGNHAWGGLADTGIITSGDDFGNHTTTPLRPETTTRHPRALQFEALCPGAVTGYCQRKGWGFG